MIYPRCLGTCDCRYEAFHTLQADIVAEYPHMVTEELTRYDEAVCLFFTVNRNPSPVRTGRIYLSAHVPNIYYDSSLSFPYLFPDVAALTDLLYISRSSAVRPTLQTLAPFQSSTSLSQRLFGLPRFLMAFNFPSSIDFSRVWCLFVCPK